MNLPVMWVDEVHGFLVGSRGHGKRYRQLLDITAHWAETGRSGYRWVWQAGCGHGKVHKARMFLRWRKEISAVPAGVYSVDTSMVRWPAQHTPRQISMDVEHLLGEASAGFFNRLAQQRMELLTEAYRPLWEGSIKFTRGEDTVEGVAPSTAPGMDNVNIITDRIPPHIAALPEEEQGPALVEAIFERKRRGRK